MPTKKLNYNCKLNIELSGKLDSDKKTNVTGWTRKISSNLFSHVERKILFVRGYVDAYDCDSDQNR